MKSKLFLATLTALALASAASSVSALSSSRQALAEAKDVPSIEIVDANTADVFTVTDSETGISYVVIKKEVFENGEY